MLNYRSISAEVAVLLFLAISSACTSNAADRPDHQQASPTPAVPKSTTQANAAAGKPVMGKLDQFAESAGVTSLSTTKLPAGETEVRIWTGFEREGHRGLILTGSKAVFIRPDGMAAGQYSKTSVSPKEGWQAFWKKLNDSGIASLPDTPAPDQPPGPNVIFIESRTGDTYHQFMFEGLCYARSADTQKVLEILNVVQEGLNIEVHHCRQSLN